VANPRLKRDCGRRLGLVGKRPGRGALADARVNTEPRRSCRRLRTFDLQKQDKKIAACGSSYGGSVTDARIRGGVRFMP
jgi:hypothetical protein